MVPSKSSLAPVWCQKLRSLAGGWMTTEYDVADEAEVPRRTPPGSSASSVSRHTRPNASSPTMPVSTALLPRPATARAPLPTAPPTVIPGAPTWDSAPGSMVTGPVMPGAMSRHTWPTRWSSGDGIRVSRP